MGTNNGQNLLNLWVRHTHAHPLLEIANFFMQQVPSMTSWTTLNVQNYKLVLHASLNSVKLRKTLCCGQDLTTCTLCTKYGPILMHTEGGV